MLHFEYSAIWRLPNWHRYPLTFELQVCRGIAMFKRDLDDSLLTAVATLSLGYLTPETLEDAIPAWRKRRTPIGQILLQQRKLTMSQVFAVLKEQATSDRLFGEIAVDCGFVRKRDVRAALETQMDQGPSLVDALVEMGHLTHDQAGNVRNRARDLTRIPVFAAQVGGRS